MRHGRASPADCDGEHRSPRDDEQLVADGPFAETKEQEEQPGGYDLIEAESDDEARAWAAEIPAARYGSIEVRPVLAAHAEASAGSRHAERGMPHRLGGLLPFGCTASEADDATRRYRTKFRTFDEPVSHP